MPSSKTQTALSRPGIRFIIASAPILAVLSAMGMYHTPSASPHTITNPTDAAWFCVAVFVVLALCGICLVGFLKYAINKGYSGWVGFWLCLGQLPGFIVLLLMPDRLSTSGDASADISKS